MGAPLTRGCGIGGCCWRRSLEVWQFKLTPSSLGPLAPGTPNSLLRVLPNEMPGSSWHLGAHPSRGGAAALRWHYLHLTTTGTRGGGTRARLAVFCLPADAVAAPGSVSMETGGAVAWPEQGWRNTSGSGWWGEGLSGEGGSDGHRQRGTRVESPGFVTVARRWGWGERRGDGTAGWEAAGCVTMATRHTGPISMVTRGVSRRVAPWGWGGGQALAVAKAIG